MLRQLIERTIEVFFLLILIYLFSPLGNVKDIYSFQGVKACNLVCMLGLYLSLVYSWRFARERFLDFSLSRLDIIMLFYGGYLFLLIVLSWQQLDREVLLGHVACGLLYLAARSTSERQVRQTLVLFPLLLVWQLWYGIAEQTFYFYPGMGIELIRGSFLNTGIWSCFVACVAIFSCGLCGSSSRWMKFVYGLGTVLCVGLLLVGNSRAAWLGFIVGVGFLFYKQIRKIHGTRRWISIVLLFVLVVVAGIRTGHKSDSALGRVLIWKISGKMCLERPLGRGIDGFRRDYMDYQKRYFETGGSLIEKRLADENLFAFNDLLRVFVEQGIVGLVLSLLLVYHIFKRGDLLEPDVNLARLLKSVLVVWLVFSLFSYPASQLQVKSIFVLCVAILSSLKEQVWSFNGKWLALSGFAMILLVSTREVYPYRKAVERWNGCLKEREVPPEDVFSVLAPLLNTPGFLANCALFLNAKGEARMAAKVAERGVALYHSYACCVELGVAMERQGKLQFAEEAWEEAGNLVPNRFRPLYLRMEMWEKAGDRERAAELADKLLCKEIKVRSPELFYFLEKAESVKLMSKTKCL